MSDSISKSMILTLLNLPDDGSFIISDVSVDDQIKYVHISRDPTICFCPFDNSRLHSKGIYKREVSHPIFQDTSTIHFIVHQRKWKCPHCKKYFNESFPFLEKYKQSTTLTPLLVLNAMKDLNRTTASIARQFFMSDTQVHDLFTAYVDLPRLSLSEIISIDEVYLNISDSKKYAFVIMDFVSGEIIDILHNRWESTLRDYFYHIPLSERKKVKYIISDAYSPYLDFPEDYFPNAVSILDSFHVIKYLNQLLNDYINKIYRKYRDLNKKNLEKLNHDLNLDYMTIKDSREMILLRDYRWVLLKNKEDIHYSYKLYYHKKLGMNIDTYRIESLFFDLDDSFETMRDLKEEYISFNHSHFDDEKSASIQLDTLIQKYKASELKLFEQFAHYLESHKDSIIRSFLIVEVSRKTKSEEDDYYSRLSNGPMESFNRKPKDYKRNTRGFSNFDYTRNRILWATRKNPPIRAIPKSYEQIHSYKLKEKILKKRRNNQRYK